MLVRINAVSLLALLCCLSCVEAAAPPPRLTPAQQKRLQQVDAELRQALAHYRQGKLAEAVAAIGRALAIEREVHGQGGRRQIILLEFLAMLLEQQEDWPAAKKARTEVLDEFRRAYGQDHWKVTQARLELADVELKARLTVAQRKQLRQLEQLHHQVRYLLQVGQARSALPPATQALGITKDLYGDRHLAYATSLNNLGAVYHGRGDYRPALSVLDRALAVTRAAVGPRHPEYALRLNNLGLLHEVLGDYRAAMPLLRQALEVTRQAVGPNHNDYAARLSNLALLHKDMGDYKAALPLIQQALAVTRQAVGQKHPDYAARLNNLALLYQDLGDYKAALPLLQKALEVTAATTGHKHVEYARKLNNLAQLHQDMGDYRAALPLFEKALAVSAQTVGEKHPLHATCLNNLGLLHHDRGDLEAALPLIRKALDATQEAVGQKHPEYAVRLNSLARLYQGLNKPDESRRCSEQALAITRAGLLLSASVQSERQQLAAATKDRHQLNFRLSLPDPEKEGPAASYRHVLAWKGAVFLHQQQRRQFARLLSSNPDSKVGKLVLQLQQTTRLLAALTLAPVDEHAASQRRQQAKKLTREKEDLERQLADLSDAFRRQHRQADLTFADLQKSLPADAALVDFLVYTHHDHRQRQRRQRFQKRVAAWVIRPGHPLVRIDLGPAQPIEEAVAAWRQRLLRPGQPSDVYGQAVRRLLWQPLAKHLQGATTVLLSPDGALARLPFAALPGRNASSYLIEEIAVAVIPVPQLLPQLLASPDKQRAASLLVVGAVDYGGVPDDCPTSWAALPATAREATAIKDTFTRRFGTRKVTELRAHRATKPAVRAAMAHSRFVHLATHGFFAPADLQSALAGTARSGEMFEREGVTGWHPLLLSGVVLAGANRQPRSGQEDGILTALEVSEMDLPGCELVVLSACETGLGREAGGEGLLGLQRAFQVAGARSVLASLWQVPDEATQVLMTRFYDNLWRHRMSRLHALREAQRWLLDEGSRHPEVVRGLKQRGAAREDADVKGKQTGRLPPLAWAAFVLSGDWR
jgi:CHAT domain-containing protein